MGKSRLVEHMDSNFVVGYMINTRLVVGKDKSL
jgi:hypothetical protein